LPLRAPLFPYTTLFRSNWLGDALVTSLTGRELNQGKSWAFLTAGIASLLLAAFSLTLPHTPPKPAHDKESSLAWLEAMRLLKHTDRKSTRLNSSHQIIS